MNNESGGSISSTPTPASWDDLANLGEYILDQLGRDSRSDNLLVHWVAHRLAEHIRTAQTADDSDERETASDAVALLIAQLWEARGGWPQGWPPDAVREFTEGVRRAAGQSYGVGREEAVRLPPWLSTLEELKSLHSEEGAAWLNAALVELDADDLRRALEAAPDDTPEPADLRDIRLQLRHHEEAENWVAAHAREGEDPSRRSDRARILGRVLEDIAEQRASLIERTLKDARRGQRRKPSPRGGGGASRHRRAAPRRSQQATS
jgi:hypothetical protein